MKNKTGKRTIALILTALLALSFASCGGKGEAEVTDTAAVSETAAAKEIDIETVASDLLETLTFDDAPEAIDADAVAYCYGVSEDVKAVAYLSSGTTEQLAVFGAGSADAAKALADDLDTYVKEQISVWSAYNAPEAKRLEGAAIVCEGSVVVLCVAGDNSGSESAIRAKLKA
jgi:hypothetical protein